MPQYHKLGEVPHKRHTQFRKPDGELYSEELFSTHGFSNVYSLIYHLYPPTIVKELGPTFSREPKIAHKKLLRHYSLKGFNVKPEDDYIMSKKPVLVNNDLQISLAAPRKSITDYFLKNADADEMIFIHEGSGTMHSLYGSIDFEYGDYLIIPRGTIFQLKFNDENNRLLIVESFSPIEFPKSICLNHVTAFDSEWNKCFCGLLGPNFLIGDVLWQLGKTSQD